MVATGILSCASSAGPFGATATNSNALRKAPQMLRVLRKKRHAVFSITAKSKPSEEDEDKESLFTRLVYHSCRVSLYEVCNI